MSNMMRGQVPGQTPGQQTEQKIRSLRSPLNPSDLSMMSQDGEISPQMSIRDYFGKFGVDVDGPVSQLMEMYQKGMQTKSPLNKMQALGGATGGARSQPAGRQTPQQNFGSLFGR